MQPLSTATTQALFQIPLVATTLTTSIERNRLATIVRWETHRKKSLLLHASSPETTFRFVHQGLFRMFYRYDDREINIQFAGPGEILCAYGAYMFGGEAGYFIEAVRDGAVFAIARSDMDKLMMDGPAYLNLGKRIAAEVCHIKTMREKELLNHTGKERLRRFVETHADLFLSLPQTYIATYLNVTPETLSALKKELFHSDKERPEIGHL